MGPVKNCGSCRHWLGIDLSRCEWSMPDIVPMPTWVAHALENTFWRQMFVHEGADCQTWESDQETGQ